jgi:hypothetical protein
MIARITVALTALLGGCGDDFDPYYLVNGPRILAIGAEPPALLDGETAALSALVVAPDPAASFTYRWSWCPLPTNGAGNFACAVSEEQLGEVPGFDLGAGATAELGYPGSRESVVALCESVRARGVPEFGVELSCDRSIPIQIKLEISDGVETVVGVKSVDLVLAAGDGDGDRNHNPSIGQMQVPEAAARGVAAEIAVDIDPEVSAERFAEIPPGGDQPEPRRERLIVSWFTDAGEIDDSRTSFIDGEIEIDVARRNLWTPPGTTDYPGSDARIWGVLRDGRGGTTWIERSVRLEDNR